MADLLSHVLIAYVFFTLGSWYVSWLAPRWIVVGMGGAILPDLMKIRLLVDSERIAQTLGIPFTFGHLGTVGGVLLTAAIVTMSFERKYWRTVYGLLVAGGLIHLLTDGVRVWADGHGSQWLFPFLPSWRPPTPNLYVTSDPLVPVVVLGIAAFVFAIDSYRRWNDRWRNVAA